MSPNTIQHIAWGSILEEGVSGYKQNFFARCVEFRREGVGSVHECCVCVRVCVVLETNPILAWNSAITVSKCQLVRGARSFRLLDVDRHQNPGIIGSNCILLALLRFNHILRIREPQTPTPHSKRCTQRNSHSRHHVVIDFVFTRGGLHWIMAYSKALVVLFPAEEYASRSQSAFVEFFHRVRLLRWVCNSVCQQTNVKV